MRGEKEGKEVVVTGGLYEESKLKSEWELDLAKSR